MQKENIIIILLVIVIILLCGIITSLILNIEDINHGIMNPVGTIDGIYPSDLDLEPVGEPNMSWNNNTKEYTITQSLNIRSMYNYENITVGFEFYKNNNVIGSKKVTINNTITKQVTVKVIEKLSEEPDTFGFTIISADKK